MKKALVFLLAASLLLSSAAAAIILPNFARANFSAEPASPDTSSSDWPMFLYNAAHTASPDDIAPITHDLLWQFNTMPDGADAWIIDSSPAVVGGVLYIGSDDGHFYALNSTSGDLLWSQTLGSFTVSSPAVVKGVVYVGVWEGRDYALNASTGEVIWNTTRVYSSASPAVVNGLYYICSGNSSVIAKNATNGITVWQSVIPSGGDGSPIVVDGTVYISDTGYACALDARNGTLKWTHEIYLSSTNNSPAIAGGIVYVGCGGSTFFALNATTGATIWTYETGSSPGSAPTVAGGIVYVGSSPKGVLALNATTGAKIWNYPSSIWDSSFALAGGVLYACNSAGIHALNAKTGALIWTYAPSNTNINSAPAVADGVLYVRGGDCYLYAFGKANQSSIALSPKVNLANTAVSISGAGFTSNSMVTATFGGQPITLTNSTVDALGHFSGKFQIDPSTEPGTFQISVTDNAHLTAYANFTVVGSPTTSWPMFMHDPQHTGTPDNFVPTSNSTLWTYKVDRGEIANQVASSAAVVEGIVYTASENGYVYAFDAYTGQCYWKYSLPGLGTLSSPSVVDGVVYIGSEHGLFALDAYTGEKIWQTEDRVLFDSSPAVYGGLVFIGSFVEQGTSESAMFAFRTSDGMRMWKFTTGDYVYSSPVVLDGIVYVGSEDNYFYALNTKDGSLVWKFNVSDLYPYDGCAASPVVINGVVYTSSYYGNVFAIDCASGSKIWNHSIGTLGSGFSSPIISNGILFIAAKDFIYALNATTGDEIWRCDVSSNGSPAIVGNIIYASSGDSKIWAIDALTGKKSLHYATEGGIRVPVAIARGVIYVGTRSGTIYAIGTPDLLSPQPTPTPTPTPTATPTPAPTANPAAATSSNPTPQPTAAITPKPTHTPNASSTITATTNQGTQIELSITGNITGNQISNVTITTDQATSTVAFTITGQTGSTGFVNLTIPKNALSTDGAPTLYIDGVPAQNQGFVMDDLNFYVWAQTHFSTHQIEIVFGAVTPTATPLHGSQDAFFEGLGLLEIAILAVICILVAGVVTAVALKWKTKK
ncbi:MAG: PQQ-binding-like beta-propeller repeat protein [Candidatus Bathyarchaeota archaeon]|nr:PQQ-binding-like beta-propeller repeat protein [Candidatus Bathyarchaeota archaeon]